MDYLRIDEIIDVTTHLTCIIFLLIKQINLATHAPAKFFNLNHQSPRHSSHINKTPQFMIKHWSYTNCAYKIKTKWGQKYQ